MCTDKINKRKNANKYISIGICVKQRYYYINILFDYNYWDIFQVLIPFFFTFTTDAK